MNTPSKVPFWPTLSPAECKLLLETVLTYHEIHYGLIFWIISNTGFTLKKVLFLQVKDISIKNSRIIDTQVSSGLINGISSYIKYKELRSNSKLFPISSRRVHYAFKQASKRAGLKPIYSPYSLRHVSGNHFYFKGFLKGFRKGGAS